jgi:hypothetical protein
MKILRTIPFILPLLAGCVTPDSGAPSAAKEGSAVESAWKSWADGDVELAEAAALAAAPSLERDRLLFNCSYAKGDYERALKIYAGLGPSSAKLRQLDEPVIDAYLHLGRYADAAGFARRRNAPEWQRDLLDSCAAHPMRAALEGTTILPFVEVPLMGVDFSDSLPGVAVELEGDRLVAHFDSGGAYLVMSPDRARSLGIELIEGEKDFAALSWGKMYYGIARSFRIGDALLENVPVAAAPQLKGDMDRVYFGTCILERFFATVDYPSRRLILSPRGDEGLQAAHLALLEGSRTETPFYLWGDHFMFARGGIGDRKDMNFFIDSGLFFALVDEGGAIRLGSLLATRENCLRWGMSRAEAEKGYFECRSPVSLGASRQEGAYFIAGPMDVIGKNLGGVRIDALLSNGFLGRYAWTIDFDRRVYALTRPD